MIPIHYTYHIILASARRRSAGSRPLRSLSEYVAWYNGICISSLCLSVTLSPSLYLSLSLYT